MVHGTANKQRTCRADTRPDARVRSVCSRHPIQSSQKEKIRKEIQNLQRNIYAERSGETTNKIRLPVYLEQVKNDGDRLPSQVGPCHPQIWTKYDHGLISVSCHGKTTHKKKTKRSDFATMKPNHGPNSTLPCESNCRNVTNRPGELPIRAR